MTEQLNEKRQGSVPEIIKGFLEKSYQSFDDFTFSFSRSRKAFYFLSQRILIKFELSSDLSSISLINVSFYINQTENRSVINYVFVNDSYRKFISSKKLLPYVHYVVSVLEEEIDKFYSLEEASPSTFGQLTSVLREQNSYKK